VIDPLLLRIISLGFALLFLIAAAHKFGNIKHFQASFEGYKIVPKNLSGLVTKTIPPLELLLGIAWLSFSVFALESRIITALSIGLLTSYALAIAINLKRGRQYIDCGCSFSSKEAGSSQQISLGLLYRNIFLIAIAICCLLPATDRSLLIVDFIGLFFSALALTLLYGTYNQLLNNSNAINSWRHNNA